MNLVALTCGESFSDEVAAVRGRIDSEVCGVRGHTALEDSFERCKVVVVLGKGQVVDEDYEFQRVLADRFDYLGQLVELFLFQLDKAQSLSIILVGYCLDCRGFACSAVAVKQDIVCGFARQQSEGVLDDLFPFELIV